LAKIFLIFLFTSLVYTQDCLSPNYYYDECLQNPPHSCLDDCDCNAGRCCSPFGWCQQADSEWCLDTECISTEIECWNGLCVYSSIDCPMNQTGCSCGDGFCNGNETDINCPEDCLPECITGDANSDESVNVTDIVLLVDFILSISDSIESVVCADINSDNMITVIDIIGIIQIILNPTSQSNN
jgi:hypothetical protein